MKKLFTKLSALNSKASASLTAFVLAVLAPAAAFAADSELVAGAKAELTKVSTDVGGMGIAILGVVAAIVAVVVVMRMMKRAG